MSKNQNGQALIILIFAIALGISIFSGAVIAAIGLAKANFLNENGTSVYYAAESGAEYGLLKLIRNPSCVANDSLTIDSASVEVGYSLNGSICTVTATAQLQSVLKKIQVQATIAGSKVTYCCWKEIP